MSGDIFVSGSDSSNNPVLCRIDPVSLLVQDAVPLSFSGNAFPEPTRMAVADGFLYVPTSREGTFVKVATDFMSGAFAAAGKFIKYLPPSGSTPAADLVFDSVKIGRAHV